MNLQETFDDIYRNDRWGGGSGPGSRLSGAMDFLADLNAASSPRQYVTLLDVGCGDGQIARGIDAHRYLGVDVSEEAIARFKKSTNHPCVRMNAADAEWHFDFALIKDVLQHLPIEECRRLLRAVRHCGTVWVLNDRPDDIRVPDCDPGGYRPIDPSFLVPEFRVRGQYTIAGFHKVLWEWRPNEGEAPTER